MTMSKVVKVSKEDRALAEMFRRGHGGKYDRDVERMAIEAARHRLAAYEQCAKVADNQCFDTELVSSKGRARSIAEAIRSLAND